MPCHQSPGLPEGEITAFLIVDLLGHSIAAGNVSETQNSISVGTLSPGPYLIRLNGNGWSQTRRWIRK
ncbi:MAG: T9SS type A sorting domain-containing protein [Bacteroidota bacterium]